MINSKFNRLKIINITNYNTVYCICECGNYTTVKLNDLKSGNTKSCGCLKKELDKTRTLRHGYSRRGKLKKEYVSWAGMKYRCLNPNCRAYDRYGGRGIKVFKPWIDSFETFLKDVGPCPSNKHSLDRINTNGHYYPSNVRWATTKQQAINRNGNRNTTSKYKGVCLNKDATSCKKWVAAITINGKPKSIGSFSSQEEAALAYNKAAIKEYGKDAFLNSITRSPKTDNRI